MIMIGRKQRQQGGAGSQQIQVAGDLVQVNGTTEERVVEIVKEHAEEIVKEQLKIAVQEFTAEAAVEATARMNILGEKVVEDLSNQDLLSALADPAFQILLRKAQLQAASTSDDGDYALLTKLLSERAAKPSKPIHLVISRATEVVEFLDPEALIGVTFLWFTLYVGPSDGDPKKGLSVIDALASKLLDGGQLPAGQGWLRRLELMDCIRGNASNGIRTTTLKWAELFLREKPGYVCEGISPEEVDAARDRLNRIVPNLGTIVVEHPFLPGRYRINGVSSTLLLKQLEIFMRNMYAIRESAQALNQPIPAIEKFGDVEELKDVLSSFKLDVVSAEAKDRLLKYVESELPDLQRLREWWDQVDGFATVTDIGTAVAFSNAKRFDPLVGLPTLSELIGAAR